MSLGTLHDSFIVNSNSKYLNKTISKHDTLTLYTLRKISSTGRKLEDALKEDGYNNITVKNSTFATILEEFQSNDIIAYITKEYIQKELAENKFKIIDMNLKIQNETDYGIYYNSNNKLKNVKKLFENIKSQI